MRCTLPGHQTQVSRHRCRGFGTGALRADLEVKGGGLRGRGLLVINGEGEIRCGVVVGFAARLVHADVFRHACVLLVQRRPLIPSDQQLPPLKMALLINGATLHN